MELEIGICLLPAKAVEQNLHTFRAGKNELPTCNNQGVEVGISFVQDFVTAATHAVNLVAGEGSSVKRSLQGRHS